jgi:hypothetical protein
LANPLRQPKNEDPRVPPREIARLLAAGIGMEKAEASVNAAMDALKLEPSSLTRAQALAVLEHVAAEPGVVGVTARFAKSRLLLGGSG